MAARPTTELEPREDTGSHRRPALLLPPPAPPPRPSRVRRLGRDRAALLVWGLTATWAGLFSWLSVQRYRGFSTGRFDLGNMVQAVWSTANGRFLDTTDVSGVQFNRLGAHVDPVLALFAPLWMVWSSPEMLLVAQAVIVALGALPAFWLGRRWLGDDRLAVAGAVAYLMAPGLMHATLFDFHPVTLAAPLLMFCIWAAEEARWVTLGVCAALAVLCQEQVGVLIVALAAWLWFRHPDRRRAAVILGGGALAWVVIAFTVILPTFALEGVNPHLSRYSSLGDSPGEILLSFVTRPWEVVEIVGTPGRIGYVLGLLVTTLFLALAAPLLALVALPQLAINLFASTGPAQTVEYHYAVLLVPVLVAAALLGLANLRARRVRDPLGELLADGGRMAAGIVGATLLMGVFLGPLPLWGWLPGGYGVSPMHAFTVDEHARALQRAVDMVPAGVPVSATNEAGSHLSARKRIHLFPKLRDAQWVLYAEGARSRAMARDRPTLRPIGTYKKLQLLRRNESRWQRVFAEDGVELYRIVPRSRS
ncbi:MAG TPA: DUF2079 domain-containing protein [Miltoncostaeaceae bacterium]|nr:DUF2079 domain-containing protein [Miltoncostaeaceae bacterium]